MEFLQRLDDVASVNLHHHQVRANQHLSVALQADSDCF